ncbi:hypothetical protein BTURTLESOX_312 [bacterium endosymbiont of Bathymodiolus sp. 5 South]|nr:hypothetical protein BTURTLESOX_312 [bacterium endosymbiont of Bathymodiolus sp. 5 South]
MKKNSSYSFFTQRLISLTLFFSKTKAGLKKGLKKLDF